jgi:hypothetical protein
MGFKVLFGLLSVMKSYGVGHGWVLEGAVCVQLCEASGSGTAVLSPN